MYNFIHHWFWLDIWVPVWPNWCAGIIVAMIAWFWKIKPHFKKEKEHREYMKLRTEQLHKHLKIKK